jgi:hypothetical protein
MSSGSMRRQRWGPWDTAVSWRVCGELGRVRQRALPDTPEGRLDAQTALGRRPAASTAADAAQGVPTVAFVGGLGPGAPVDLLREARVRPSAASAKAADALRPGAPGWARPPGGL